MKKALFLLPFSILAVSCGQSGQKVQDVSAVAEVLPTVSVEAASFRTVRQDEVYSATVAANIVNNIAPQTPGRIQKVNVEIGDFVNEGRILAEMDRVQLDQAALRLANSKTELERIKTLYEEGGVSQSDYEAAVLGYNVSKSSYDNLEENTILRSPVTGVVTARNYDRGDMYSGARAIFTVEQISPVKMLVGISETDYSKVSKGDKVTVVADAIPGKQFSGSIVRIHPTVDAASHTFNAEIRVPNTGHELRPGMFVRATVNFGENRSIVVPDVAVLKQQGSGVRMVFVLEADGTVSQRNVTPGRHFDSSYEILSGLNEGDKVVVKGQASLKAGEKVKVIE